MQDFIFYNPTSFQNKCLFVRHIFLASCVGQRLHVISSDCLTLHYAYAPELYIITSWWVLNCSFTPLSPLSTCTISHLCLIHESRLQKHMMITVWTAVRTYSRDLSSRPAPIMGSCCQLSSLLISQPTHPVSSQARLSHPHSLPTTISPNSI